MQDSNTLAGTPAPVQLRLKPLRATARIPKPVLQVGKPKRRLEPIHVTAFEAMFLEEWDG